ncbi:MAG: creatininase family protein [Burkholderiales bacterium]|nr:creatininase family protein [Burkholderiales bacterium]MDE2160218.1 creatininase family protein [Burkholderiales bacterium]MDE2503304.1 creatininase family protein [Burkholderiales bacterium]
MSGWLAAWLAFGPAIAGAAPAAPGAAGVELEQLTWPELRARIDAGARIALVPIGGTEQSGTHMVLGKHNARVRLLAQRIALALGDAIVAPVIAYVPEGDIDPPTHHMRWPGTLTLPVPVFEAMLESTARSLRHAGFCDVVFLGDHGGYQASLKRVAARIDRDWARSGPCRVHAMPEYYRAADVDYARMLKARGYPAAEIGSHAGLADTSLALAVDPALVRMDGDHVRVTRVAGPDGVSGDPRRATAALGRLGLDHIVEVTVAAIRAATRHPLPSSNPRRTP